MAWDDAILTDMGWNFRRPGECEEATAVLLARILEMVRESGLLVRRFCVGAMAPSWYPSDCKMKAMGHHVRIEKANTQEVVVVLEI